MKLRVLNIREIKWLTLRLKESQEVRRDSANFAASRLGLAAGYFACCLFTLYRPARQLKQTKSAGFTLGCRKGEV